MTVRGLDASLGTYTRNRAPSVAGANLPAPASLQTFAGSTTGGMPATVATAGTVLPGGRSGAGAVVVVSAVTVWSSPRPQPLTARDAARRSATMRKDSGMGRESRARPCG